MDLVKIGFQINANGLKDANKQVDSLLGKVDQISSKGKKSAADFESSQKKIQGSTKATEQQINKQLEAEKRLAKQRQQTLLLEQTKSKYINQGFGKGASTQLAKMEISGADTSTLNKYQQALTATKTSLDNLKTPFSTAIESNNKLLASIKGIAAYALLSTAIYGVITAVGALTTAFVSMADEYTAIQNRMKLYIKDAGELGRVNAQLAQMSIENNVGLRETATLFSRLLPAMQKIGANTAAVTSVVDAFGKSMRIGGTTAQEAASATIQFSQAMASGKLAGDEFRSISEASPRFLQAIAEGSKKAASELKAMSAAGLLTTEVVSKALLDQYPKLIEENKKLGVTLEQGANAIKTGFLVAIGEFNEGAKVTQYFGEMMLDLAKNMFEAAQGAREFGQDVKQWFTDNAGTIATVAEAFKILATVVVSRYVVAMIMARTETIKTSAAFIALNSASSLSVKALTLMSFTLAGVGRAASALLAFFGGPVGLIATLAGAAVAYATLSGSSSKAAESFRQEGESLSATIDKYKQLAKVKQQAVLDKEIANLEELNKQYDENKAKLVTNVLNLSRHNDMTKAQAKSMSDLALSYKNGDISLEQLVSTVSKSGFVSNDSKVKTRGFAEAVIDAGEKAGVSKDLINAMRKALADNGETAKISKTGVDTFTKGLEDQAKKLRETTALARKYGLEIASAAKLQEQLASQFGAKETRYADNIKTLSNLKEKYSKKGFVQAEEIVTKQLLANQQAQKSLLKDKVQVTDQYVKGLKDVEAAQKEQSDYTDSLRKRDKKDDKDENSRERILEGYSEEIMYVERLQKLLSQNVDVDVARIAATKEYASVSDDLALAQEVAQARLTKERLEYRFGLAEETELLQRIQKIQDLGISTDKARALAQAGFRADAEGVAAAAQLTHNDLVNQSYVLADQVKQQIALNHYINKGVKAEEAAIAVSFARLAWMQKSTGVAKDGLTDEQKKIKESMLLRAKELRTEQQNTALTLSTKSLLEQNNEIQKDITAETSAYTIALTKARLANMDASEEKVKDLVLTQSTNAALLRRQEVQLQLNNLAKGYTTEMIDFMNAYPQLVDKDVERTLQAEKLYKILKKQQEVVDKKKETPFGDFSKVDFNVFGDFGNPLEEALAGVNTYISKMVELQDELKTVKQAHLDAKEAAQKLRDASALKSEPDTKEYKAAIANIEYQAKLEQEKLKEKKAAQEDAFASGLKFSKSFFKEESKGYKVVSALEQALQAKKIAFAIWEKRDTLQTIALKIVGYAKDLGMFLASVATKVAAQLGFNASAGVGAILSAAQQPGPAAFVGFAAMAALVAGLGIAMSGGSGSSGTVTPSNDGTGTVFGDSTAQSESIKKSIDLLADNSDLMLPINNAMLRALQNIENALSGVANLIIRGDIGNSFASNLEFDGKLTGVVGKLQSVSSKVTSAFFFLDKFTGLDMGGLFNGIRSTILGGLFGKTSQSVTGSGLFAGSQSLGSVLDNGLNLQQYADVATTKKSWFSKSTSYSTQYGEVDQEIKNQFGLIFDGIFNSILTASSALGKDGNEVTQALRNSIINIGKIDTKGLTGEEIQKKLEAVISAQADTVAKNAVKGLDDFQKVGEGYYETLVRVATGIEQANYFTDRLNVTAIKYADILNKQGDVATEIVRQSVLLVEGNKNIKGGFYDLVNTFDGTAEELSGFIIQLRDLQDQLFMTGKNADYLTSTMILGAGGLDNLASGLDAYFEMLSPAEQAAELTRRLTKEFAIFGKDLPSDVKAFRNLVNSIDISTEAGQKLYGQVLALAPEFNDLQDSLDKANSEVNALVKSLRDLAEEARRARGETQQPSNLAYVRSQFQNDSVLAMQGDTAAAERLLTLGKDLMSLSKQYSISGSEYAKDLALIQRAATVSADVQEAGLGYTPSTTLSTALVSGNTASVIQALEQKNATLEAEIKSMREDTNAGLLAIAKFTQNMDSRFDRWDDGNRMIVGISSEQGDTPVTVAVVP